LLGLAGCLFIESGFLPATPGVILETIIKLVSLVLFAKACWTLGQRWRAPDAEAILKSGRPLILYLRSFRDDGSLTRKGFDAEISYIMNYYLIGSIDQRLARQLRKTGALVAVGRPSDVIPP